MKTPLTQPIICEVLSITSSKATAVKMALMKTTPLAILYFLVASVLGAVGQFFYKAGADRTRGTLQSYLLNSRILLGACCYIAVMVLFVAAFKQRASPSALYPLYATTFIWAAFIEHALYGRTISAANVTGMALLVGGMYLLGRTT
jgi:drug/metabolite transporter (DMT)-like permease